MPIPRLDDAIIEYSFTREEEIHAQILDPLKIAWYQTMYSRIWKMKASEQVPDTKELELPYIQRICELDGQLGFIQQLFDSHKAALQELATLKASDSNAGTGFMDTTATRAASLVNS